MSDGGNTDRIAGRRKDGSRSQNSGHPQTANPETPAAPIGTIAEPWKSAAVNFLLGYLAIHTFILIVLTLYPFFFVLPGESLIGAAYLDIISKNIHRVIVWIISPLLAVISVAALWNFEMKSRLRWLIILILGGLTFSILFYVVMVWMEFGIDLWQAEGPPDRDQFKSLAGTFSIRNFAVFVAVLMGVLGAKIPNWIGNPR